MSRVLSHIIFSIPIAVCFLYLFQTQTGSFTSTSKILFNSNSSYKNWYSARCLSTAIVIYRVDVCFNLSFQWPTLFFNTKTYFMDEQENQENPLSVLASLACLWNFEGWRWSFHSMRTAIACSLVCVRKLSKRRTLQTEFWL